MSAWRLGNAPPLDSGGGGEGDMSEKEILLPCPFCGSNASFWFCGQEVQVICNSVGCEALGPARVYESDASAAWNSRSNFNSEAVKVLIKAAMACKSRGRMPGYPEFFDLANALDALN